MGSDQFPRSEYPCPTSAVRPPGLPRGRGRRSRLYRVIVVGMNCQAVGCHLQPARHVAAETNATKARTTLRLIPPNRQLLLTRAGLPGPIPNVRSGTVRARLASRRSSVQIDGSDVSKDQLAASPRRPGSRQLSGKEVDCAGNDNANKDEVNCLLKDNDPPHMRVRSEWRTSGRERAHRVVDGARLAQWA
jgi:hypothetical protein